MAGAYNAGMHEKGRFMEGASKQAELGAVCAGRSAFTTCGGSLHFFFFCSGHSQLAKSPPTQAHSQAAEDT